jgi:hypothetical protein
MGIASFVLLIRTHELRMITLRLDEHFDPSQKQKSPQSFSLRAFDFFEF